MATLFLIPTPLGEEGLEALPSQVLEVIHRLDFFIVERAKTTRHFLKKSGFPRPLQELTLFELNKRTTEEEKEAFLKPALNHGFDIGLMSEAGCPGVADPGATIVQRAHQLGIRVVPMVGPSSILLALMASGMSGQQFAFHGYLSPKRPQLIRDLKRLEQESMRMGQTQIFMETPYRNSQILEEAMKHLAPSTLFGVAADLTLPTAYTATFRVATWRKRKLPKLHKRPTVFTLFAG